MTARDDDLIRELNDELARRRAASTYVNSMWWAIHDALGGEWHPPDADHAARWVQTWETLLAAQAVVADRDALRDALGKVRALCEAAPTIRWPGDDSVSIKSVDASRILSVLAAAGAPEPCPQRDATVHLDSGPRDDHPLCGTVGTVTCEINDVTCEACTTAHNAITEPDKRRR